MKLGFIQNNYKLAIENQKNERKEFLDNIQDYNNQKTFSKPYPESDIVQFYYYIGRIDIFENNFKTGVHFLKQAYRRCRDGDKKQKNQILKYLIPAYIYFHQYPTIEFLKKSHLLEYAPLVSCLYNGNLRLYDENLDKNKQLWIIRGIYMSLQKLKQVAIRNLFQKVYKFYQESTSDPDIDRIPLDIFIRAFNFSTGTENDEFDLICIFGSQTQGGYIKSTIKKDSSSNKYMVFFKKGGAFPAIKE